MDTFLVFIFKELNDHFFYLTFRAKNKENDRRWYCLEQLLNKTLREQHAKDTSLPAPHPTIATMGMNRKQRTAATKPYTRIRIDKMRKVGMFKVFL